VAPAWALSTSQDPAISSAGAVVIPLSASSSQCVDEHGMPHNATSCVCAYSLANATLLWCGALSDPGDGTWATSVAIGSESKPGAPERVFVGSGFPPPFNDDDWVVPNNTYVRALDGADGRELWAVRMPEIGMYYQPLVSADGASVYAAACQFVYSIHYIRCNDVYRLDAATGEVVWHVQVVVNGDDYYVGVFSLDEAANRLYFEATPDYSSYGWRAMGVDVRTGMKALDVPAAARVADLSDAFPVFVAPNNIILLSKCVMI
jgi:outer membrane protein assembly factor BamB